MEGGDYQVKRAIEKAGLAPDQPNPIGFILQKPIWTNHWHYDLMPLYFANWVS